MWLIRSEEEANSEYGKSPNERTLEELVNSAVIVLDKHSGPTSHQCTAWIKNIFIVNKAGHAGTLDPAVTGVLPIELGNSTKAAMVLSGMDKEYVGVMHLHKDLDEDLLRKVVKEKFLGKIRQTPPVKSAVARRERERTVYYFDIVEIDGKDALFKVGCEAGTYIRKLVHDLGQALKVGAHMSELRRTKVGNFTEEEAHSLLKIRDIYQFWKENRDEKGLRQILIPVEDAISNVKRILVKDSAVGNICNGAPVYPNGICKIQEGIVRGETIAVNTLKGELVAFGISKLTSEEMLKRSKGAAVRTDKVFMEKGTYGMRE